MSGDEIDRLGNYNIGYATLRLCNGTVILDMVPVKGGGYIWYMRTISPC